jgi:hypothetical protein
MSRWEFWSFGVLNLVLALSGGVYFCMKYLMHTEDPFAVVNHPWQPSMLAGHVVAAPVVLVLFGSVLRSHILKKLAGNGPSGRRTGWTALISFAAMALSGYLLQVVASPGALRAAMLTHVATSILFMLGYSAHLVAGWRFLRRRGLDETPAIVESRPHVP